MKKIGFTVTACVAIAGSVFAGQEMKESKDYKTPAEPCFKDRELQLDVFATYTDTQRNRLSPADQDGFGGGLGVNYFFIKYLGVGVEGHVHGEGPAIWDLDGRLIARYPIDLGHLCLAPYAFGGGGHEWIYDHGGSGTLHVGGGLEFRITPKIGIFAEGRYTWVGFDGNAHDVDGVQARLGARFVF